MATLTIDYIANYPGNHRICYRRVGTLDYCCIIHNVTTTGPQTAVIDFSQPSNYCEGTPQEVIVPIESECGPYSYEGYIQPVCEPEESLNRVNFGPITFTQNVSCKSYEVECERADVKTITLQNGGAGYLSIPSILVDTGPIGCSIPPVISVNTMGVYFAQAKFNGGLGTGTDYSVGDILEIVGGTGTPAQVVVTSLSGSSVLTVSLLSSGSYTSLPGTTDLPTTCVTCANSSASGALVNVNYTITSINISSTGEDCGSTPIITVLGGSPEIPAIITAEMLPCNKFIPPSCANTSSEGVSIKLNEKVTFCSQNYPTINADNYSVTPKGNCCDCIKVNLRLIANSHGGSPSNIVDYIYYTDPVTKNVIYIDNGGVGWIATPSPGTSVLVNTNVVPGSVGIAPNNTVIVDITTEPC